MLDKPHGFGGHGEDDVDEPVKAVRAVPKLPRGEQFAGGVQAPDEWSLGGPHPLEAQKRRSQSWLDKSFTLDGWTISPLSAVLSMVAWRVADAHRMLTDGSK